MTRDEKELTIRRGVLAKLKEPRGYHTAKGLLWYQDWLEKRP